jgi:hypothetical protein
VPPGVTNGNVHAQATSKWWRFCRLLPRVRRVEHDGGSDDSYDPEVFFLRTRSEDPEVDVSGGKSEVSHHPLYARVRTSPTSTCCEGGVQTRAPQPCSDTTFGL